MHQRSPEPVRPAVVAFGLFVSLLLSLAVANAQDAGSELAVEYIEALFAEEGAELNAFHDAAMIAAMTQPKVDEIRDGLLGQYGAIEEIEQPWAESQAGSYLRFRVPVRFEKTTLDARVVIDANGKVAGFNLLPHVDRPADESEAPGISREVEIGEAGDTLPGTLLLPPGDGPFPGVVLVHGSGPNDRDESVGPNKPFREIAWGLAERGIATLRYDKRSLVRPESLASLEMTVKEEVIDDAVAAIALLRRADGIDPERVYVLGHSLGGNVAPRIAAVAEGLRGVIVLAGMALSLPDKTLTQLDYLDEVRPAPEAQAQMDVMREAMRTMRRALDGEVEPPEGFVVGAPFSYYRDLEDHDAPKIAAELAKPILVLQGDRDYQVTLEDFALWEKALGEKELACLKRYATLDHLMRPGKGRSTPMDYERREPVANEVIEDIASWVGEGKCPR